MVPRFHDSRFMFQSSDTEFLMEPTSTPHVTTITNTKQQS